MQVTYCDFCGKEITHGSKLNRLYWEPNVRWDELCLDCYRKVQAFIATIKDNWDPRKPQV